MRLPRWEMPNGKLMMKPGWVIIFLLPSPFDCLSVTQSSLELFCFCYSNLLHWSHLVNTRVLLPFSLFFLLCFPTQVDDLSRAESDLNLWPRLWTICCGCCNLCKLLPFLRPQLILAARVVLAAVQSYP